MTLADSNVWLALSLAGHTHHRTAVSWLNANKGHKEIRFCRATQHSFLRLLTTAAVHRAYGDPPLSNVEAWKVYEGFLGDVRIGFSEEPKAIEMHWRRLASQTTASPKLWMDAYLAAFAVAGKYRLVTTDTAFQHFDGLDLVLLHVH